MKELGSTIYILLKTLYEWQRESQNIKMAKHSILKLSKK